GMGGFPGGGFGNTSMSDNFGGYGGPTSYGGSSTNTGSINTPWGQSGSTSSENTSSTSTTSSTSQTANTGRPTPPDFASQTSSSSSTNPSTTASNSASQPVANASALTATNTALSNQGTSTSKTSNPKASLKTKLLLLTSLQKNNRTGMTMRQVHPTRNQETAEKLDSSNSKSNLKHQKVRQFKSKRKMLAQSYRRILHKNKIQALSLTSLIKVHKATKQKSSLPNTGDVSSLGLGALGAVLMTTSFAIKGSKHSRK
ncbi:MAG: LPXTG cell wall anchor domain-containing protein, partial [Streptococcus salivarius]